VRVTGTLVEDKMRRFKGECEHFSFKKCPIYTHDGASAKFSPNSQEMDNSEERVDGKITMEDTVISPQFGTVDEAVMEVTLVMDE
jgi:hypothetical protein